METEGFIKNFNAVISYLLEKKRMTITDIVKSLGFTTTNQLHRVVKGDGLPSSKALELMVINLKVNPNYLFLGKGDMFLSDESEIDNLRKANRDLIQKHNGLLKDVMDLTLMLREKEIKYEELHEMAATAIKSLKTELKQLQSDKEKPELQYSQKTNDDPIEELHDLPKGSVKASLLKEKQKSENKNKQKGKSNTKKPEYT